MANPHRLTADQCVELIKEETGDDIKAATFRVYAHRGQAPASVEKIGRTPLWSRSEILEWANNRPGKGARTDLRKTRWRTKDTDDAT
ncbi:transcriptional regulator [Rhodococcus sp. TAF43]|uniref:transcriptional regulator n=1 Tax=Rhodococcus sp. TAF43 TaxID=3237483 RepID=UPI003F954D87